MNNFDLATLRNLLLALLISTPFLTSAQKDFHNAGEVFSSVSPVLSYMDNITGWSKQNNGSWLSDKNRISLHDEIVSKPKLPHEKLGRKNIISLELRRVMIDDDQYMALIYKYKDGKYEFPYFNEGWTAYNSYKFYVFKGEKLYDILPEDFEWNTMWGVNLDVFAMGTVKNYDDKDEYNVEDHIKSAVMDVLKGQTFNNYNIVFGIYALKDDNGEYIRFQIVETFRKDYLVEFYTNVDTWERANYRELWEVGANVFKSFIHDAEDYLVDIEEGLKPIDEDPSYRNLYNWGVVRYQMGDYKNSIEYFKDALEVWPESDDFMLYAFRGNAYSKREQYTEAISDFDKALSLEPKNIMDYSNWVRNYFNRGVSKYYLNDINGACKDWNKALELGFGQAHDYVLEYCE